MTASIPKIAADSGSKTGLLGDRDFTAVLVGQAVSAMGSAVTMVAMPLLVLLLTGSGLLMGIVGILETAPDLLIGLPAGALADRWDRRKVMILADAGRAALTALIPMAVIAGVPAVPVILVVVAPINLLRVLFSAAQNASIPTLAGRDRLSAGAAYFEAVWAFGYVLGPALAGTSIAIVGPGPTIALDAFSFAFSAGSVLQVRRSLAPPPPAGPGRSVAADVRDGLRYVWSHRPLRLTIAYYAVLSLLMAPFVPAFTYFLVRDRGMDAGGLGLMISIFSSGMVVGALVATRLKAENLGSRMVVAAIVTGAGLAVGRSVPSPLLLGLMGLVMGAAWTVVEVSYVTLRLAASPEALLGRISTVAKTATVGVQPVGMLVGGLLIDRVGGGTTLAAMGLMTVVLSIGFWASGSLRNRQPEGPAEPAGSVAGSVVGKVAL